MTKEIDGQLEHQIVRYLDGELDEAQEEMLLRELMRNPQARQLMDRYTEIDKEATAALKSQLGEGRPVEIGALAAVSPMRWRPTSAWRIAAAVAMLLLGTYTVIWTMNGKETLIDEALVDAAVLDELEQALPIDGTFASQRQIERDYVAYFDKQQNRFYLVEVDHEWTAIQTVSSEL